MMKRFILLITVIGILGVPPRIGGEMPAGEFEGYFRLYGQRFFGVEFDWRYFKAQAIAESGLRPDARSPEGAVGVMQLLPCTFQEIADEVDHIQPDIQDPQWNIAAGIYYDRKLWETWKAKRPFRERLNFTFGSYNAGKGAILRAQEIALVQGWDAHSWKFIEKALPRVIGEGSRETIGYVRRIHRIRQDLGS